MQPQTLRSSSPSAGRSHATTRPRVRSPKESQPSSTTDTVLNIPEYDPDMGELRVHYGQEDHARAVAEGRIGPNGEYVFQK